MNLCKPRLKSLKVLLVNRVDFADPENQGIYLKMQGQKNALEDLGHRVTTACLFENTIQVVGDDTITNVPRSRSKLILYQYLFYRYLQNILPEIQPDVVILRFHLFHRSFSKFIGKCHDSGIHSILEFPTFPFQAEFTSVSQRVRMGLHNYYRHNVLSNIRAFFHYGSGERIYQRSSLRITNGIDLNEFELPEPVVKDSECTLMAIGKWQYWHGIDRLVASVAKRKEGDIRLLVVGDTPYLKALQTPAIQSSPQIEFLGSQSGENLTAAFSRADLGVGVLGLHRKGMFQASPLKHREYCARGIPFIYSCEDEDFDSCDFVKRVPANDDPVDLNELKEFCQIARKFSQGEIRSYAEQHLSWDDRMQKVMDLVS